MTAVVGTTTTVGSSAADALASAAHHRHITAIAMRGGAGVVALLTAYVLVQVWQRLEYNQKRRISERMRSAAPELSNFKTGPLWLGRAEKHDFLTDLCSSDPAGPLLVTGPRGSGKSMLLRRALTGRPGVAYFNLRSSPVVSADNLTVSLITRCGYLLPPNELLGRAVFNRGAEPRQSEPVEVERGLRLITDVLLAEKARGWLVRAPDGSQGVVPPLLCIDELNYAEVGGDLLEDPVFWRLLDWLLHVSDNRLAHVVLCTSLHTAELLDRYPGFRARRQRVYIDYPRDYTVNAYLHQVVNPFLKSQLGAVPRRRPGGAPPVSGAAAAAAGTVPASSPETAGTPIPVAPAARKARSTSWFAWLRSAFSSSVAAKKTPVRALPASTPVPAAAVHAQSQPSPPLAPAESSPRDGSSSSSAAVTLDVGAMTQGRADVSAAPPEPPAVPRPAQHVETAADSGPLPAPNAPLQASAAVAPAQPEVSRTDDDESSSLAAATAMPVAAAKAALRAQQQAAVRKHEQLQHDALPPPLPDIYAAESPPVALDPASGGGKTDDSVVVQRQNATASAASGDVTMSTPPVSDVASASLEPVIDPVAAGGKSSVTLLEGSSTDPAATSRSGSTTAAERPPPARGSNEVLAATARHADAPPARPSVPTQPVTAAATAPLLRGAVSRDAVSVDTAAGVGPFSDSDALYILEPEEIDAIVGTVGGHLQDLLTVVTAVTRGQSWGEALERLVADSTQAVEHALDDVLLADDLRPGGGAAQATPGARRSRSASLSLDHARPAHDYQAHPSPQRLAAYGRYVRTWTLLCALASNRFVSKRELAARVFPACPHELDFLEATGLVVSINVKADARVESASGFLELQSNHPGVYVSAATPRLRVAFRVVTRDPRLQVQTARMVAALRVAALRQRESELSQRLPELVNERAYALQLLQALLARDTTLRSTVARELMNGGNGGPAAASPLRLPEDAPPLGMAGLAASISAAQKRYEGIERDVDALRASLTVVRTEAEAAIAEASEPSVTAVTAASWWESAPADDQLGGPGVQATEERSSARGISGVTAATVQVDGGAVREEAAAAIGSAQRGEADSSSAAWTTSSSSALAAPQYASGRSVGFDLAAAPASPWSVRQESWTNPPPPPPPLQPAYYSSPAVPSLPAAAQPAEGDGGAAAARRAPLSPRRRWRYRRPDASEPRPFYGPGSAAGGAADSDDEGVPNGPPRRDGEPAEEDASWRGNPSGAYRWWL